MVLNMHILDEGGGRNASKATTWPNDLEIFQVLYLGTRGPGSARSDWLSARHM